MMPEAKNPMLRYDNYAKLSERACGLVIFDREDWDAVDENIRSNIMKKIGMVLLNTREDAEFFMDVAHAAVHAWKDE